jgi:alpha-tubulin suppressor-like RCC1 family protein
LSPADAPAEADEGAGETAVDDAPGMATVANIALGSYHSCARMTDGTVRCWGYNLQGQVGDGTTTDRSVPVQVLTGAVDITAGLNYTCAVMLDGTVMCWGDNDQGQLADGSSRDQTRPAPARLISGLTNIDAGQNKSCGLTTSGLLRCVNNGAGITANGLLPVAGATFEPSLDVAVSRFGSVILALDENGVPVVIKAGQSTKIEGAGNAIDVDSGFGHFCALLSDGTVKCWGANSYGQLGSNSLVRSEQPQLVTGLTSAWQIAVGKNHTCVLIETSDPGTADILCWGLNGDGQLGNGSYTSSPVPVIVK